MTTATTGDRVASPVALWGDGTTARTRTPSAWNRLLWLSVVLATTPIVAAVIRALSSGWMPVGDNAYFTVRSRDVLTQHHPLLGAWSAGSHAVDVDVNNLGPLQLDLLAPFTKIAPVAGTAIGVGVIHLAAVVGIALTLRRLVGPVVAILGMAVTTGVAWSLGSALLVETRQHHYLVLPFLCFIVLAWAVSAGAAWALPWTAFVASLLLQTHLTYGYLVAGLSLWALAGLAVHARGVRAEREHWSTQRKRLLRYGEVTVLVLVLCWIQPIIDQVFRTGNLANVLRSSSGGDALSLGAASRLVASVVALPPWWARPSFQEFDPGNAPVSTTSAVVGLAVTGVLLGAVAWSSHRVRSRVGVMGVGTAVVAVLLAVVNAMSIPVTMVGSSFPVGNYRWVWPISSFVLLAIASGVAVSVLPRRTSPTTWSPQRFGAAAIVTATAVLAILSIPAAYHAGDPDNVRRMPITAGLIDQLEGLGLDGPVFYDRGDGFFAEPYTYPVLFRLQELGIEFTVGENDVLRFGTERRESGQASHTLKFVWGGAARQVPAGARRVAFVPGIDEDEQRELRDLSESIVADLKEGRVGIDLDVASASSGERFAALVELMNGADDVSLADVARELGLVVEEGLLPHDTAFADDVARWLELRDRRAFDTVALLLIPVDTAT